MTGAERTTVKRTGEVFRDGDGMIGRVSKGYGWKSAPAWTAKVVNADNELVEVGCSSTRRGAVELIKEAKQ